MRLIATFALLAACGRGGLAWKSTCFARGRALAAPAASIYTGEGP